MQITIPLEMFTAALSRLARGAEVFVALPAGRRWENTEAPSEVIAARAAAPGRCEMRIVLVERFFPAEAASLPETCVAFLAIGRGLRLGRARGWMRDARGDWHRARHLFLPGPRMIAVPLGSVVEEEWRATSEDVERWSRTRRALGPEVHNRLRKLSVGIVGLGRLGSILSRNLAGLGVSRLALVDPDVVERHNLGEGDFFTPDTIGQRKVHAWENWLALHKAHIEVEAVPESVAHARAIAALGRCDVLFSVPDHPAARHAAAAVAAACARPLIDAGTRVLDAPAPDTPTMGADMRLVLPERCVLCFGGAAGDADAGGVRAALASPDFERAVLAARDGLAERAGSLHSLNQLAAALAIRLLEDLVAGRIGESRWVRAEFTADGRVRVSHPAPAPSARPCLCALAGFGDAAFPRVLPLFAGKIE